MRTLTAAGPPTRIAMRALLLVLRCVAIVMLAITAAILGFVFFQVRVANAMVRGLG